MGKNEKKDEKEIINSKNKLENTAKTEENNNKKGIYNIALKTIDIMTNKIAEIAIAQSDYIIEPKVGHVKILAIDKMNECYQKGYEETIKKIVEIQSVLRGRRLAFKCCFC